MHGTEAVSPWVARWAHLVPSAALTGSPAQARVLDVACGAGRHLLYFLKKNRHVAGIDIAHSAIEIIANQLSKEEQTRCELIHADIENAPWPMLSEGAEGAFNSFPANSPRIIVPNVGIKLSVAYPPPFARKGFSRGNRFKNHLSKAQARLVFLFQ